MVLQDGHAQGDAGGLHSTRGPLISLPYNACAVVGKTSPKHALWDLLKKEREEERKEVNSLKYIWTKKLLKLKKTAAATQKETDTPPPPHCYSHDGTVLNRTFVRLKLC